MTRATTLTAPDAGTATARGPVVVLAVAGVAVGLGTYATALLMTRLLPAAQFARYGAGQSLLLVIGTGAMAALPWAVSRFLVDPAHPRSPQEALHFALSGSLLQGLVLGGVALLVSLAFGPPGFAVAVGLSALVISLLAAPVGFLQGTGRFAVIGVARVAEVVVRGVVAVLAVHLAARDATAAIAGFGAGAAVTFAGALYACRAGLPLRRPARTVRRDLTRQAALLGGVQVLLAALGALDTVYVAAAGLPAADAASYQAAALVGRVPLFLSAALCTACYPALVATSGRDGTGRVLRAALRHYAWLTAPFVVAALTVPGPLLHRIVPADYGATAGLLRFTCLLGLAVGAVNVVSTAHLARQAYRTALTVLAGVCAAQAVVLLGLGRLGSVTALAAGGCLIAAVALAALCVQGRHWLVVPRCTRGTAAVLLGCAGLAVAGYLLRGCVPAWLCALAVLGLLCLSRAFAPHRTKESS